jgi:hypothetical protein
MMSAALRRWCLLILVLGVTMAGAPRLGLAQTTVTSLRGLAFGAMVSGVPKTVPANSASSLAFRISAVVGAGLGFSLMLPTSLARTGGGASLPVQFCTTCGLYRLGVNSPSGGTVFNPNSGVAGLTLLVFSDVYVWVGATASPPLNQPSGSYSGTVTLNVVAIL